MVAKIAFCFLLYDTLEHRCIWEHFFCQADPLKYSLYAHFKTVNSKSPKWLTNHKVGSVVTGWCGEGLVNAFSKMLTKGLEDPDNKYFCLISGTDVPLYKFAKTYEIITGFKKSRLQYSPPGNIFETDNTLLSGHQWVILKPKEAKIYKRLSDPNDMEAQNFIKELRKQYLDNGVKITKGNVKKIHENYGWIGGCPDEVYPINWFVNVYKNKINKHLDNKMTTYTHWDFEKDNDHPTILDLKKTMKIKNKILKTGAIFARKFENDAADLISLN
jgi:hypothetical protein